MITALTILILVILLVQFVIIGVRRGFMAVAAGFIGLLLGLVVAAIGYPWLGRGLVYLKVVPALANVVAYIVLVVGVQFLVLLGLRRALKRVPADVMHSRPNAIAGGILGGLQIMLFVAIGLAIFANLPVPSGQRQAVTDNPITRPLTQLGNHMQGIIRTAPGSDLTETLNLLTVEPQSDHTRQLGYTTTRVQVNVAAEAQMLALVNRERTVRGLPPLKLNKAATEVARAHSRDMFAHGYFSHRGLDGSSPFDRMRHGKVAFTAAGENLALAPTLELAHSGLMDSPGHRANILSPDYRTVGIGVIESPLYGLMITQNFTD